MGIALPPWIVEAHNNGWVLGAYGVLFGIGLPVIVVCIHELRI
jgi:translocation protein SEC63